MKIVLGTRGSELALRQARMAEAALRERCEAEVQVQIIRTGGDESAPPIPVVPSEVQRSRGVTGEVTPPDSSAPRRVVRDDGRKGLFTAELERALMDKRIDVAVHSAKDLPSEMNDALNIAAVLPRGAPEDVLITKQPVRSSLAVIATGSVRRQRQARWLWKPRELLDLRGNVPTRLHKFAVSNWDAIVLARAGLERLGFSPPEFKFEDQKFSAEILPVDQFVPAGGQGVIALQTRAEDVTKYEAIDDFETQLCLRAEREFLRLLQGDCNLPVGAHARYLSGEIELLVQMFTVAVAPKMAAARGDNPEQVAAKGFEKLRK